MQILLKRNPAGDSQYASFIRGKNWMGEKISCHTGFWCFEPHLFFQHVYMPPSGRNSQHKVSTIVTLYPVKTKIYIYVIISNS
jgi:hypothetical protein